MGRSADGDTKGLSNVDGAGDGELNGVWARGVVTVLPVVAFTVILVVVELLGRVIRVKLLVTLECGGVNGIGVERRGGKDTCRDDWTRVAGAVLLS